MTRFRICSIGPSGALDLSPMTLSAEAAARRNLPAFMEFYEECKRVAEKYQEPKAQQLELRLDHDQYSSNNS